MLRIVEIIVTVLVLVATALALGNGLFGERARVALSVVLWSAGIAWWMRRRERQGRR